MHGTDCRRTATLTASVIALLALGACATGAPDEEALPAPAGTPMTSANIAGVAETANTGEIQLSQLALQRSSTSTVREFAQRMITDHGQANQRIATATTRAGVAPTTNTISQRLSRSVDQTMEALRGRSGRSFDRAYMDNQVELHRWTLSTLDDTLIPGARNARDADLRAALVDMRATVADHLQRAEQIRRMLND